MPRTVTCIDAKQRAMSKLTANAVITVFAKRDGGRVYLRYEINKQADNHRHE